MNCSTGTAFAVESSGANDPASIGHFLTSGVADGQEAWVQAWGIIRVKADAGGIALGQWCGTGATAKATDGDATPGPVAQHFQEQGHGLETIAGSAVGSIFSHRL